MKVYNKNLLIIIFGTFLALFVIEIFFSIKNKNLQKNIKLFDPQKRYMLFQEGSVFQNVGDIFKYIPKKKILSKIYYKINNNWIEEYSYTFTTNNFGLVQKNDLKKNLPSILFLGDSFIEGQGASPWVDNFSGDFKNYQIINGGILGTGPQQFELLEKHISETYKINKVILFYIGDDIRRNIFNIKDNSLKCLSNHTNCVGNENFYGFPFNKKDPILFLNKLSNYRENLEKNSNSFEMIKSRIKKYFNNLFVVKIPYNFIRQKFYTSKNKYIQRNFKSIKNLKKKYGENIYFIQLKSKNEIIYGKEYDTFFTEKFIKNKISKKHFYCNFEDNINFFHKIDMHPNKDGYQSLYKCVKNILSNNIIN